jgi:hypothetical protein
MTGGVKIDKLPQVVSGRALGQEPQRKGTMFEIVKGEEETARQTLSRYYASDPEGLSKQPIWASALQAVQKRFNKNLEQNARELLGSVIALMAQIPIEKRMGVRYSLEGPGLFLAKTDYAKILHLVATTLGAKIPMRPFLDALVDTINSIVPPDEVVKDDSPVLPASHGVTVNKTTLTFTELTLKDWVEQALPEDLFDDELLQGRDRLSSEHFPGTPAQQKQMRAYGTFGSRTDPGNKAIFEWRSFAGVNPDELEIALMILAKYLAQRVNT